MMTIRAKPRRIGSRLWMVLMISLWVLPAAGQHIEIGPTITRTRFCQYSSPELYQGKWTEAMSTEIRFSFQFRVVNEGASVNITSARRGSRTVIKRLDHNVKNLRRTLLATFVDTDGGG